MSTTNSQAQDSKDASARSNTAEENGLEAALDEQTGAEHPVDERAAETAVAEDAAEDEEEEEEELIGGNPHHFLLFMAMPAWMVSVIVHMLAIILLALMTLTPPVETKRPILVAEPPDETEEVVELPEEKIEVIDAQAFEMGPVAPVESAQAVSEVTEVNVAEDVDQAAISVNLTDFADKTAPKNDLMREIGALTGNGLEGRGAGQRGKMVARFGGTKGSEEAVAMALRWLAEHQMPDGGWAFDHTPGLCSGRCSHAGTLGSQGRNGATALALLPFLGAGQTHMEGAYKANVKAGLFYLISHMKQNGSLSEPGGSMYSHGLCSIALCEAYAMTNDRALQAPAQLSLNYIVYAQDPVGGGWRYQPRQAGDTSVVGWQLMALKSGHMAYLQVPPATVAGANRFLDAVQASDGARYGYTGPANGPATSAVGLLCRMYLGWKKDNLALQKGVEYLAKSGPSINPSKTNMYYNYYATQVMRHHEGPEWKAWNEPLREYLVSNQDKKGHEKGSWFMTGDHGSERGGRLYCTSMATMILEVYYRHMPIYGKDAAEEDFPL